MHIFLTFTYLILLGFIVYHDFKHLAIPVYLLIILILIAIIRLFSLNGINDGFSFAFINLLASLLVFGISFLVVMISRRAIINPINSIIGSGDLVFFIALCLSFSPLNFLIFIIVSFGFALFVRFTFPKWMKGIPLAGIQALLLIMISLIGTFGSFNLYSDTKLMNLVLGL